MKKVMLSSFVIVVIVLITILMALTPPKESKYSLHIVADKWSDQDIDYPEAEFNFENITSNNTYVIPLEGDTDHRLREFKVVDVEESSITISTSLPLSNGEDGTRDLDSAKTKFVIEYGKSSTLETISMSGGEWYVLTLIEKK